MKKAKLWAYLMSGLLTFSTLASDYQIAYAEEAVEADAAVEVPELAKEGAEAGYSLEMLGTEGEGGSEDFESEEPKSDDEENVEGGEEKKETVEGEDEEKEPVEGGDQKQEPIEGDDQKQEPVEGDEKNPNDVKEGDSTDNKTENDEESGDINDTLDGEKAGIAKGLKSGSLRSLPASKPESGSKEVNPGEDYSYTVEGTINTDKSTSSDTSIVSISFEGNDTVKYKIDKDASDGATAAITIVYTNKDSEDNEVENTLTLNLTVKADDNGSIEASDSGISLSAPEGAFPAGTKVTITDVTSSTSSLVYNDKEIEVIKAVDIVFTDSDNTELHSSEKGVTIDFSSLDGDFVFHVTNSGVEVFEGKKIENATSFSVYGLGKYKSTDTTEDSSATGDKANESDNRPYVTIDGTKLYINEPLPANYSNINFQIYGNINSSKYKKYVKDNRIKIQGGSVLVRPGFGTQFTYFSTNDEIFGYIDKFPADFKTIVDDIYKNGDRLEWYSYEVEVGGKPDGQIVLHANLIEGNADTSYTIKKIIDSTGDVLEERTIQGVAGQKVKVNWADRNYTNCKYLGDENLTITLDSDPSKNIMLLKFQKTSVSTKVQFYYGDAVDANLIDGPSVAVGKASNYKDAEKTKEYGGKIYTLDKVENITSASEKEDENIIKVYYKLAEVKYQIVYHYQNQARTGYDTVTSQELTGKQGEGISISQEEIDKHKSNPYSYTKTVDYGDGNKIDIGSGFNINYTEVNKPGETKTSISADEVKATGKASDNELHVYYDRIQNVVYYSILLPGQPVPDDASVQDKYHFSTGDYKGVQGVWEGTADSDMFVIYNKGLNNEWKDYANDNSIMTTYNASIPKDIKAKMNAWITSKTGWESKSVDDVIWYTYKSDEDGYTQKGNSKVAAHFYINGYIPNDNQIYNTVIKVNAKGDFKTYDGTPLTCDELDYDARRLPAGYTLKAKIQEACTVTHVSEGEIDNLIVPGSITVWNGETEVTSQFPHINDNPQENLNTDPGKLYIKAAPLTVTTGSQSWVYDGAEHQYTEEAGLTGLVNKETLPMEVTGVIQSKGTKTNTCVLGWSDGAIQYDGHSAVSGMTLGSAISSDYDVTENLGKLTITERQDPPAPDVVDITLTAGSYSKEYDGKELTYNKVTSSTLPSGYSFEANAVGSQTNVGRSANEVASDYKIFKNGADVTNSPYVRVTTVQGYLAVRPKTVTVKTGTKSKTYDGTPLVCEEASIATLAEGDVVTAKATGTITEVGSTTNTYEIDWGTVNKDNYTVLEDLGTLTITETNEEILVTVTGGTYMYDGEAHGPIITVSGAGISYTNDASNGTPIDNLGTGEAAYYVEEASSTTSLTDVSSEAADVNTLVIRNASGADVTSKLKITKDTSNSTVKVVPTPLTITTKSASKVYDGSPLKAGGSIDGLVARDQSAVTFKVTGSQTEVGSSKNTYSLDWGSASADNYTVTEKIGTLTVTAEDTPVPDPTADDPSGDPDTPSGDPSGNPDTPSGDPTPAPGTTPVVPNITTVTPNPTDAVPPVVPVATTTIPDDAVPLAGVLGQTRGIEADAASVLGARVPASQGVLGARRDAQTADSNQMALYLILMGIATGVGGAYITSRRHKRDFLSDLEMMQ